MADPTVACILLTRDRPEYARRAVECFRAQTYDPCKRFLVVYDTGDPSWYDRRCDAENEQQWTPKGAQGATIGALRNSANNSAGRCDIFMHFDSDDWSHPNRIAEQVALLQLSGADCVGYREVLFWQEADVPHPLGSEPDTWDGAQAYLYTNNDPRYCIGSSFCYWRKAWEARPFEDVNREEDGRWLKGVRSVGVTSFPTSLDFKHGNARMICRVHAGNAKHYPLDELVRTCPSSWRRTPEWDAHCREVLG